MVDFSFAKELAAKNIRVNALLPGLTETHFSEALVKIRVQRARLWSTPQG